MEVWIVFKSYSWHDVNWRTEWNIYGIYDSETKAKKVIASLEAEQDDFDETEYRMQKHSIQ